MVSRLDFMHWNGMTAKYDSVSDARHVNCWIVRRNVIQISTESSCLSLIQEVNFG